MNDPKDTRWEYTYHGRLANYGSWQEDGKRVGPFNVDQIENVIAKLVKQPFTRQAQMITWMPNIDMECYDPPASNPSGTGSSKTTTARNGSTATSGSAATTHGARAS